MKKILFFAASLILCTALIAQAPQGISHQAVIRNTQGELVTDQNIGVRVSILQGSAEGTAVFVESHTPLSNQNGLITYVIGQGTPVSGVFADIDWADGPYFLKTEVDPEGGTSYTIEGIQQLFSVPYALHAKKAENVPTVTTPGAMQYWDGLKWVAIQPGEHNQTLRFCNGVPTWGQCTYNLNLIVEPIEAGTVHGSGHHEAGEQVNIMVWGNPGWDFVNWTDEDNTEVSDTPAFLYNMPASNVSLTANFTESIGFTCGVSTITDIDGNIYRTVQIGDQCWIKENLKTTRFNNGDYLPSGLTNENWSTASYGAFSIMPHSAYDGLNSEEEVSEAYGLLYNWYAVDDSRGLCPTGWHIPSEIEWNQLLDFVDLHIAGAILTDFQLSHLVSCGVDHPRFFCNINGCSNFFDFDGVTGGMRNSNGSNGFWPYNSGYWSNTHITSNDARAYIFHCFGNLPNDVLEQDMNKKTGFSVRCVKY